MPEPRYEDRVTSGGLTFRENGRVISRGAPPQPVPGPQYATETRGAGPVLPPVHESRASAPHLPVTTTHVHEHHAYGATDGTPVYGMRPGYHLHEHTHSGDNSHAHHNAPGHPGNGAPDVALGGQNSMDPGGEVSGIGPAAQIRAFLESQGVDVDQALRDRGYAREHAAERARARVQAAGDIAFQLRKARRKLWFEQQGFASSSPGFTIAKIGEAQERVKQLDAALREACVDDPEMIRDVTRRAGR